jgi:hypothetical protein
MNPHTKTWEQSKSRWRVGTADGRWVPSLKDLGADLTIDYKMVTRRLLVEDCYRLHIGSLFKSGRVGAGSSGTWRGQRWRIEGAFLMMQDKRWRLFPAQQKNVNGTTWLVQSSKEGDATATS